MKNLYKGRLYLIDNKIEEGDISLVNGEKIILKCEKNGLRKNVEMEILTKENVRNIFFFFLLKL